MTKPQNAKIFKVMIASPGEANDERRAITEAINRWNAVHGDEYHVRLQPVMWETDATPGLEGRPQRMINKQLIPKSHLMIAVFHSKIGSPTGTEISGTVEEIREFMKADKPILLYFYQGEVLLQQLDAKQYSLLDEFRREMYEAGIIGDYRDISQLREHLSYHLTTVVQKLAGSRNRISESIVATVTEPMRKRADKKAKGIQTSTRKTSSPPLANDSQGIVDSTGNLILLGEEYFTTRQVRFKKDSTITIEIPSNQAETDAALGRYRPQQYSRPSPIPFAHGNYGQLVRVTETEAISIGNEQIWTLTLTPEEVREGVGSDVQYKTNGKTYTPEDFAKMQAGRLLLNNPPPPSKPHGYDEDVMLEIFISSDDRTVSIKHCIMQEIYGRYCKQPHLALQYARLQLVFYFLGGRVVETIEELSIGPVLNNYVHVRFRGRCRHRNTNESPVTIEIEGDCLLEKGVLR